jgi:hypothetical protein
VVAGPEEEQDATGIGAVFAEGGCAALAVVLDAAEPAGHFGVTGVPKLRHAARGGTFSRICGISVNTFARLSGFRSPMDSTGVQKSDNASKLAVFPDVAQAAVVGRERSAPAVPPVLAELGQALPQLPVVGHQSAQRASSGAASPRSAG